MQKKKSLKIRKSKSTEKQN